jgi:GNAT superfamily N-acetyltransferase
VEIEIRSAVIADAEVLSNFIRGLDVFSRFAGEQPEMTADRVRRHLKLCLADDSHSVLVAVSLDGEHLLGYAAAHWLPYLFLSGPEGYVSELFVHNHFRGRGVGSLLLDAVIDEARHRGCARLLLSAVKTRESYLRAFYPKRGWVERTDMAEFVLEL